MIFKKQAEEDFNIQVAEFPEMESLINRCANIYRGAPEWLDDKKDVYKRQAVISGDSRKRQMNMEMYMYIFIRSLLKTF